MRVPFVARWPGRIPEGRRPATLPAMTIDLLPTLAALAGAQISTDRIIDGRDIWPVIAGQRDAKAPHDALYFYWGAELHAVRARQVEAAPAAPVSVARVRRQRWHSRQVRPARARAVALRPRADVGETTNVLAQHPDVVKQLMEYVERAREDLGDSLTKRVGKNVRPAGKM